MNNLISRTCKRIELHLRRGQYTACHDIIDAYMEGKRLTKEAPIAIAELDISLRWVNMIEGAGYIYIDELEGVDLRKLLKIPNFGAAGLHAIETALGKLQEVGV